MNTSLINNQIYINNLEKYAAIIGESPSSGARSPKLWNAVFAESGLNYSMVPMDVSSHKINDLLISLNQDANFIGGAVAVPYKEVVAKWLGENITHEAKRIGAVNCLFRDENGKLKGTNTDGEAAIKSFEYEFGPISSKKILILGLGGAGKAVSAYYSSKSDYVTVTSRSAVFAKGYAKKIKSRWIEWKNIDDIITEQDIIVNCTTAGFGEQESISPLTQDQISSLKKSTIIFDIIYQPLRTKLLTIANNNGLRTFNGLNMNLDQAVLAYKYTVDTEDNLDQIKHIMSNVNKF